MSAILYQLAVTGTYRRGHKKEQQPEEIRMCRRRTMGGEREENLRKKMEGDKEKI